MACRTPSSPTMPAAIDAARQGRSVHHRHRPRDGQRRCRQQDRHLSEGAGREGQWRALLCGAAVLHHRLDAEFRPRHPDRGTLRRRTSEDDRAAAGRRARHGRDRRPRLAPAPTPPSTSRPPAWSPASSPNAACARPRREGLRSLFYPEHGGRTDRRRWRSALVGRADAEIPLVRRHALSRPNRAWARIWRCAPTRRGCWAPIRGWCCMAAATPRSRPRSRTCWATTSRCSASRARAGTWAPSSRPGLPAVRLAPLRRLRALDTLSDEDMVTFQRINLLDPSSPNPIGRNAAARLPAAQIHRPHPFHRRAGADRPAGRRGHRARALRHALAYVPYVMPGFALAKSVADIFDANPDVEGLVLLQHGIFTMGETAHEAYERMIAVRDHGRRAACRRSASRSSAPRCRNISPPRPRSRRSCAAPSPSPATSWPAR